MIFRQGLYRKAEDSGAALVTAIFSALVISLLAASIISVLHIRTLTASRQADLARAELLADTAEAVAAIYLLEPQTENTDPETPPPPDNTVQCQLEEGSIVISIEDEAGKIDLNTGALNLLEAFANEIEYPKFYRHVLRVRQSGARFGRIEDAFIPEFDLEGSNPALEDTLRHSLTVEGLLPMVDTAAIVARPETVALRRAVTAASVSSLNSPRRVFRLDISTRTANGLSYGRTAILEVSRDRASYTIRHTARFVPIEVNPEVSDSSVCALLQG